MNWRAVGCLVMGMVAFVGVGLLGLSLAFRGSIGCPQRLQWEDRAYLAVGTPAPSPVVIGAASGDPAPLGSTFRGPITRRVYGPPGSTPSARAADRPESIALDCGDGSFQAYQWDGITLSPPPSP